MSLLDRLADAQCLFEQGRYDGALAMLLLAIRATTRPRIGTRTRADHDAAFVRFIDSQLLALTGSIAHAQRHELNVPDGGRSTRSLGTVLLGLHNQFQREGTIARDVLFTRRKDVLVAHTGRRLVLNVYLLQGLANLLLQDKRHRDRVFTLEEDRPRVIGKFPPIARVIEARLTTERIDLRRRTSYIEPRELDNGELEKERYHRPFAAREALAKREDVDDADEEIEDED